MGLGVLPDHDRVVHDDAQGHDQGEQADHVDAAAHGVEHRQGGHEGDRDAHRHPEGDPGRQEQIQDRQYQQQTAGAVVHQQHDALFDQVPAFVEDLDPDALRQGRGALRQPLAEDLRRLEGIAVLGALQHHHHGLFTVLREGLAALSGLAFDLSHRPQIDAPAPVTDDRQVTQRLELLLEIAALVEAAQLPGAVVFSDQPRRQVLAQLIDALTDLGQAHAESAQLFRGDADLDRLFRQSFEVDLVDAPGQQFLLEPARQFAQFRQIVRTADQQPGHRLVTHALGDLRVFRVPGQAVEVVHLLLDLIQGQDDVGTLFEFQIDAGHPGGRGGGHLLEVVHIAQALFQGDGDAGLHVLGTGTAPEGVDRDVVQFEIGEKLYVELVQGQAPGQQHDPHQQVGRDLVVGEGAEQVGAMPAGLFEAVFHPPTTSTLRPLTAFGRWVRMMRSPARISGLRISSLACSFDADESCWPTVSTSMPCIRPSRNR